MFNSAKYFVTTAGIVTIATIFGTGISAADDTIKEGILLSKFKIPTVVTINGKDFNVNENGEIVLGFKVKVGDSLSWTAKPKSDSYISLLPKDEKFTSCAGKSKAASSGEITVQWSSANCKKP